MKIPAIVIAIIFLGLSVCYDLRAQDQHKVDSLKQLLDSKKGIERFDVLFELVREYGRYSKNEESLVFLNEAFEIPELSLDTPKFVRATRAKGQLLGYLGRLKETVPMLNKVIPIAQRHNLLSDLALIYNTLGSSHNFLGNYPDGLRYLFKSLALNEQLGNEYHVSMCLNNIGVTYYKLKDCEKALEYYLRSLEIKKLLKDDYDLDLLYVNIGLCYIPLSGWHEAETNIAKGLEICNERCDYLRVMGYYGYGWLNFLQKDYREAEIYLLKSYQVAIEENESRHLAENLVLLAQIEINRRNFDKAERYLKEAEQKALPAGYKHILTKIYETFSIFYKELHVFDKASFFQQKYIQYKDSIMNESVANKLAVIQVEYEKQQNAIALSHKNEIIKRQQIQTALISVVAVLLVGLAFALYKIVRSKQTINRKLDQKVRARTTELERSRDALQRSYAQQNNFLFKTVNEIQGPIASLKGISNTLSRDHGVENVLPYVSNINVAAEKLDQLVSNLSGINNSLLVSESTVDIASLIDDTVEQARLKNPALTVTYNIKTQITVRTNVELFKSLFRYIFNLSGQKLHISVDKGSEEVLFRISSDGKNSDIESVSLHSDVLTLAQQLRATVKLEVNPKGQNIFVSLPNIH